MVEKHLPKLPEHRDLGGDPEPLGTRFDTIAASERRPQPTVPVDCPLALALGGHAKCRHGDCVYWNVPGREPGCALMTVFRSTRG